MEQNLQSSQVPPLSLSNQMTTSAEANRMPPRTNRRTPLRKGWHKESLLAMHLSTGGKLEDRLSQRLLAKAQARRDAVAR